MRNSRSLSTSLLLAGFMTLVQLVALHLLLGLSVNTACWTVALMSVTEFVFGLMLVFGLAMLQRLGVTKTTNTADSLGSTTDDVDDL